MLRHFYVKVSVTANGNHNAIVKADQKPIKLNGRMPQALFVLPNTKIYSGYCVHKTIDILVVAHTDCSSDFLGFRTATTTCQLPITPIYFYENV